MRSPRTRPPSRLGALAPALAATLALSSCATRISVSEPADPAASLPREASVYLLADRPVLEEAAGALLAPADFKAVRPFLSRTDRVTAALILPPPDAETKGPGSTGMETGQGAPSRTGLYGIAEGSYPAGAASFRLRLSREWRKEGRALVRRDGKLRVAFAGRQLLAAATSDLEPLLDRLAAPGPHPVPGDLRPYWEAPGALWLPRPGETAETVLGAGAPRIPARGLLLTLSPGGTGGGYTGTWIFVFDTERDARVYAPICRLAHLAFIRAVHGPGGEAAVSAALERTVWTAQGAVLRASGFPVDLSSALGALRAVLSAVSQGS